MRRNNGAGSENLNTGKREWICAVLFSVLSSAALCLGYCMEKYGSVPARAETAAAFAAGTVILAPAARALFGLLDRHSDAEKERRERLSGEGKVTSGPDGLPRFTRGLLIFLFLMVCYLVVLLAVYPGFFVYDAYEELAMFRTGQFTTHHPLTHVLLTGGVISAVHDLTGSWNAGIFAYSLIQASCISVTFLYLLDVLRGIGVSRGLRVFSLLYLALFPTVVMFVLCTCKDGIFAASLLVTVLELLRLFRDPGRFWGSPRHPLMYVIFAALLMLYRHNGLYMYIVFLPFFLVFGRDKQKGTSGKRRIALLLRRALLGVLPLIIALGVTGGLKVFTGAEGGEHQEALSVPIQQLARTYSYEPESFSEEEKEILVRYIPESNLSHYTPKLADPVKIGFVNSAYEADRASFWKLWLNTGLHHPMSYLNAWLATCYGEFYPWTVIDCYRGNSVFTITYEDSSYFGFETEEPGIRQSFIPLLEKVYRHFSLDDAVQRIPVFRFFYSPGGMAILFLFVFLYAAATRRNSAAAALLPVMLTYLTVLLGPCSLPRYVCYFWFLLPLAAAVLFDAGALKRHANIE